MLQFLLNVSLYQRLITINPIEVFKQDVWQNRSLYKKSTRQCRWKCHVIIWGRLSIAKSNCAKNWFYFNINFPHSRCFSFHSAFSKAIYNSVTLFNRSALFYALDSCHSVNLRSYFIDGLKARSLCLTNMKMALFQRARHVFNKDCQWERLIRHEMETGSLRGQAKLGCD